MRDHVRLEDLIDRRHHGGLHRAEDGEVMTQNGKRKLRRAAAVISPLEAIRGMIADVIARIEDERHARSFRPRPFRPRAVSAALATIDDAGGRLLLLLKLSLYDPDRGFGIIFGKALSFLDHPIMKTN